MTFTKKKLAAAVSSALVATGMASTAFANVDVDNDDEYLTYSTSLNVDAEAGLDLEDGEGKQDLVGVFNENDTPADTDVRLTVTLSNGATFNEDPGAWLDTETEGGDSLDILTGGSGSSSVVFFGDTGNEEYEGGDRFRVDVEGINVVDQGDVEVDVTYQIADNFGVTDIKSVNTSYVTFADSFALSSDLTEAEGQAIDVTQSSLFFAEGEGTESEVGEIVAEFITEAANGESILNADSETLTSGEVFEGEDGGGVDITITAANGLAAFADNEDEDAAVRYDGTNMDVEGTTAVLTGLNFEEDVEGAHSVYVRVPDDNTVQIDETTLTATVTGNPDTGYNSDSLDGTVDLLPLARNGSSARLTFALTPAANGGVYQQFIRLTNPSGITGPVTLQLINDDGDSSAVINLSDIEGIESDDLAAGASTKLIKIGDVAAADPDFTLGATNKLRVEALAEFGATGESSSVVMGAFSLSTDGNTFNMMTNSAD